MGLFTVLIFNNYGALETKARRESESPDPFKNHPLRAGVIGYTVRPNFRSGGPYSLREYGPPPGPNSLGNTVRLKYCTSREYSPGEEADSIP